ncbi:MAG: hypothetical protein ACHQUC_07250, partial [Chlamydiales bacterium]
KRILCIVDGRMAGTLDEIDEVTHLNKEHNFPIGKKLPMPQDEIELIGELYQFSSTDPEIIHYGLKLCSNEQATLTNETYELVKDKLCKTTICQLCSTSYWRKRLGLSSKIDKIKPEEILNIIESEEPHILKELYTYLRHKPQRRPDFVRQMRVSSDPLEQRGAGLISLLKCEFDESLRAIWKESVDTEYGFSHTSPEKGYVIPFSHNNSPKEDSEYSNGQEVSNKTFMGTLVKGLNEMQAKSALELYTKRAEMEWVKYGYGTPLEELPSFKKFFSATGFPLPLGKNQTPPDLKKLAQRLSSDHPDAIEIRIEHYALFELKKYQQYKRQIFNNAANLVSLLASAQGYAGIIKKQIIPSTIETTLDIGTKGEIIDVLIEQNDNVQIVSSKDIEKLSSVKQLLTEILGDDRSMPEADSFHGLVDIGPRFKGISSHAVAKEILDFFPKEHKIQGVIYWDDETNEMTFIKRGIENNPIRLESTDADYIRPVTHLNPDQLSFSYPHSKVTGAHADLPDNAIIIVTVDSKTTTRDFLQGVMRARKLFKRQRIIVALPENVARLIAEETHNTKLNDYLNNPDRKKAANPSLFSIRDLFPFLELNESEKLEQLVKQHLPVELIRHLKTWNRKKMLYSTDVRTENSLYLKGRSAIVRTIETGFTSRTCSRRRSQETQPKSMDPAYQDLAPT